jgi:hypothetical protein
MRKIVASCLFCANETASLSGGTLAAAAAADWESGQRDSVALLQPQTGVEAGGAAAAGGDGADAVPYAIDVVAVAAAAAAAVAVAVVVAVVVVVVAADDDTVAAAAAAVVGRGATAVAGPEKEFDKYKQPIES